MKSLDMKGPFPLESKEVDDQVSKKSAGNYALGKEREKGNFIPKYVGRSDTNVNARIKDHVDSEYPLFKFSYAESSKEAFKKECKNYHDFVKNLDNDIHPDRPDGKDWKCPVCNVFG